MGNGVGSVFGSNALKMEVLKISPTSVLSSRSLLEAQRHLKMDQISIASIFYIKDMAKRKAILKNQSHSKSCDLHRGHFHVSNNNAENKSGQG